MRENMKFTYSQKTMELHGDAFSYLSWKNSGTNVPTLHFAHANGMNALTYRRLLEPLSKELRISALDMRGHGQSLAAADPAELKSWKRYGEDLLGFVNSLGRPLFLAGHSMGGVVSMELAAHNPELVDGLCLIDPVIFPQPSIAVWGMMKRLGVGDKIPIAARALKRRAVWPDRESMLDYYRGRGAFATWRDELIIDYLEGGTRDRKDGQVELTCTPEWESRSFASLSHRQWKTLGMIRCPITLIYGGKSDTFLEKAAKAFEKNVPDARIVKIESASHFVPMEFPDIVRTEILRMCLKKENFR